LLFTVADESRARIFRGVAVCVLTLGESKPLFLQGLVIVSFGAGDIAGFFVSPFRNLDIYRYAQGRGFAWPHYHQIILIKFKLVERSFIGGDDLAQIKTELLERGVTACLVLKLRESDVPFCLLPQCFRAIS